MTGLIITLALLALAALCTSTRALRWLHLGSAVILERRGVLPPLPIELPPPDDDDGVESDAPLPPAILDALRATLPRRAPRLMPDTGTRFVVWSRGFVDTATDDPKEAKAAFARVVLRAGTHQFWDRQHLPGPRNERIIPQGSE